MEWCKVCRQKFSVGFNCFIIKFMLWLFQHHEQRAWEKFWQKIEEKVLQQISSCFAYSYSYLSERDLPEAWRIEIKLRAIIVSYKNEAKNSLKGLKSTTLLERDSIANYFTIFPRNYCSNSFACIFKKHFDS